MTVHKKLFFLFYNKRYQRNQYSQSLHLQKISHFVTVVTWVILCIFIVPWIYTKNDADDKSTSTQSKCENIFSFLSF